MRDGGTLRVKVGSFVLVDLYQGQGYEATPRAPRAFLWAAPTASDPRVLGNAALCPAGFTIGIRYEV